MRLSILIASLPQRHEKLARLLAVLSPQVTDGVEILINIEKGKSIGAKRNDLVNASKGDYVCFVDDDDMVPVWYVVRILLAIETNPDVVTIEGMHQPIDRPEKRFIEKLDIAWLNTEQIAFRNNNHLCPTRIEIALECPFPEINMGEDKNYGEQVAKIAKTEVHIEEIMYYYKDENVI